MLNKFTPLDWVNIVVIIGMSFMFKF